MSPIDCSPIEFAEASCFILGWIMELKPAFGTALKLIRNRRGMTQEDFGVISSRTYLSSLERGLKCPTLEKVEDLAALLNVHPLTVLAVAYTIKDSAALETLMRQVKGECEWVFSETSRNLGEPAHR